MRTIQTNVYKFKELSTEGKKAAIGKFSDINTMHNWWEFLYEDANNIGVKITGFDMDNGDISGKVYTSVYACCAAILENHGKETLTYSAAIEFQAAIDNNETGEEEQDQQDVEQDFINSVLTAYLDLLKNDYEYLCSEASIIETIEANDYEFLETGETYN